MKKYFIIAAIAIFFMSPPPSYASDVSPEEAIENVKAFYMELQKEMNESDFDSALSIIDQRFAKDFLHYDDGEVSYGKDGMILFVENHKKANVRTTMNIDITETSFDPEKSEVTTNFHISQKFYKKSKETGEEYEDTDARMYLTCNDSLRVQDADNFELYKCDCVTGTGNDTKQVEAESIPE